MPRARDPLAPRPPPRPSREDSREIVEAIVEAAMELADADPTMNAIATRAGVGVASVYRYFPNKGAIFSEISRRLHRRFLAQLREVMASPSPDLQATIRRVCEVVVHGPGISVGLRRTLNTAVPASWSQESADDVFATSMSEITTWLQARLEVPPPDLARRVFVAFSASRGMVAMSMVFPDLAPSPEELVDHMARGVTALLFGPGTTP